MPGRLREQCVAPGHLREQNVVPGHLRAECCVWAFVYFTSQYLELKDIGKKASHVLNPDILNVRKNNITMSK